MGKPWTRGSGASLRGLVRADGTPVYADECCCPGACSPACVWAAVTVASPALDLSGPLEYSSGPATCDGMPDETIQCRWQNCTHLYPDAVELRRRCDGQYEMVVTYSSTSYTSAARTGINGAYTFASGGITASIAARDASLCGAVYACVRYMKTGETWDVARVCVPACAIPNDYASGWTEDAYGTADYFTCSVTELTGEYTCPDCLWIEPYIYQILCARKNGGAPYYLYPCDPWPSAALHECALYGESCMRWQSGSGDNDSLYMHWDGRGEYAFYGGSAGVFIANGPFGTYNNGYDEVVVYACP